MTPETFEAIQCARKSRDRAAGSERSRPGRPNTRFMLWRLATCASCGEPMACVTSTYRRKDGTRARSYLCSNVKHGTGLCAAPSVSAEQLERRVADYLRGYFVDFDSWLGTLTERRASTLAAISEQVEREREKVAALARREAKMADAYERAAEDGNATEAGAAADAHARRRHEREQAEHRMGELEAMLEDARTGNPVDSMLDWYSGLALEIRGALDGRRVQDINTALRARFGGFVIETVGVTRGRSLVPPDVRAPSGSVAFSPIGPDRWMTGLDIPVDALVAPPLKVSVLEGDVQPQI